MIKDILNTEEEMYLVGCRHPGNKVFGWSFIGIFTKKKVADFNCLDEHYFYAPVILNKGMHCKMKIFPNIVYPRVKS